MGKAKQELPVQEAGVLQALRPRQNVNAQPTLFHMAQHEPCALMEQLLHKQTLALTLHGPALVF